MRQGFTLLWMGWQWDVPAGRMRMEIPIATDNGQPITGWVRGNFIPGANADDRRRRRSRPPALPGRSIRRAPSTITTCARCRPIRRGVAARTWRFTGAGTVTLDGGFEAGRIYDVVYRARDPRVVGVGLAGTRDLVSFFKHASAAEGNPMPGIRTPSAGACRRPAASCATSSTKASTRTSAAASSSTACSIRWAAPAAARSTTASGSSHAISCSTSTSCIRWTCSRSPTPTQTDPETGVTDGLLARAARSNTVPKFFHLLTNSEYFNRAGSLVHTDVTGTRDVPPPATSRIYMIASAPHIVGAFPPAPFGDTDFVGRADMNPLVYTPVIRALFRALDRWVADGVGAAAEPVSDAWPTAR